MGSLKKLREPVSAAVSAGRDQVYWRVDIKEKADASYDLCSGEPGEVLGETSRAVGEAEVSYAPDSGGAPVGGGSDDRPSFVERGGECCQVCCLQQRQVAMQDQP